MVQFICCVEVIRHVTADDILYWTFAGLKTSFAGCFNELSLAF